MKIIVKNCKLLFLSCFNMTKIASSEEIVLHINAINVIKNIIDNNRLYNEHFYIKSDKCDQNIKNIINKFVKCLKQLETPIKIKRSNSGSNIKKNFNSTLNMIKQKLTKSSELHNILFINSDNKFVSNRESHFAKRINLVGISEKDFIVGSESNDKIALNILRMSIGRCGFETLNEMLQFLLMCVEKTGIDNLVIQTNSKPKKEFCKLDGGGEIYIKKYDVVFRLNLNFDNTIISSSSSKIKHFLCGSNWNKQIDFNPAICSSFVKSTLYHQYNNAVYTKIYQLIDMCHNDLSFKYVTIKCCRQDPVCNLIHIEPRPGMLKLYECSCKMQLCGFGCGKVYHGDFSCDVSLDKATEQMLATHSTCPKCKVQVYKYEGCNHITCRCNVQFCYVCLNEYEKDSYGHYMVTEHHRNTCPQFD